MFFFFGRWPERQFVCSAQYRRSRTFTAIAAIVVASLFLPAATGAQTRAPLTVAEAERLAVTGEPGQAVLDARADAIAAEANVVASLPDPVLRVGLNNYPFESGGFSTEGMTHVGVGLRQAFPRGKTRALRREQLEWQSSAVRGQADARQRDVTEATRIAWLDLFYWRHAHTLVSESRPFFADLVTITRSLYSVGRRSQQDVLRAELELSRLDDRLIDIERERESARARLAQWVGDAAIRPLPPGLPAWTEMPDIEEFEMSISSHPLLASANAGIEASRAAVDVADQRAKPGWSLDVGYSYREGQLPSGQPRSDFVSVGVTVDLPFFRKSAVDDTLTSALRNASAAESERERLLRGLRREIQIEHTRWHDLSRRLDLYEDRLLGQARAHARASLDAYQSDTADFADVMRAYIDDLDARVDHLRLKVERAQTWAVLANLGGF